MHQNAPFRTSVSFPHIPRISRTRSIYGHFPIFQLWSWRGLYRECGIPVFREVSDILFSFINYFGKTFVIRLWLKVDVRHLHRLHQGKIDGQFLWRQVLPGVF